MFEKFGADAPHIFGLLGSPMTARALAAYDAWKAWRAKGTDWIMETERLLVSSPREFLDRNFESPEIRATLGVGHALSLPDMSGGALFPYLESMANQAFGMVIGAGGADTMIKALVARLAALGGKLHLHSEVVETA